jgi:hypothetical protein
MLLTMRVEQHLRDFPHTTLSPHPESLTEKAVSDFSGL